MHELQNKLSADMLPITEQPVILRDNLLSPNYKYTRRGSQGRMAKPEGKVIKKRLNVDLIFDTYMDNA